MLPAVSLMGEVALFDRVRLNMVCPFFFIECGIMKWEKNFQIGRPD